MTTSVVRHRAHITPALERDNATLARTLRSAACYFTVAILAFGPLAFGAVEPWALLILQIGSVAAFTLWLAAHLTETKPRIEFQIVHLPLFLFACIVVGQILLGGTAYRHETVTQFMNYVAYGLIFLISTDMFREEERIRQLCLALAVLGFALAALGSVQEFTAGGKLYWVRSPKFGGPIFGPYVNRNHYAGAMELLFPFALIGSLKHGLGGSKRALLAFASLLMIATIFLCGSRGGFIAVVLQIVFLAVIIFWRSRHVGVVLSLTLLFVITAAFGTWLGSDRLLGRLAEVDKEGGRIQLVKDSMLMFREHPVTGWGLGTFPVVYPKFRSFATDLYVNEAHNDFIQLLVETGILGFGTGIALLIIVFRRGIQNIRNTVFGSWRTIGICASLVAVVGLSVHSLFDFNLQIPANALLFYVMCAVAGGRSEVDSEVIRRVEKVSATSVIDV